MTTRLLIIACLALAGCAKEPERTATGIEVTDGGGSAEIQEVVLPDGTRCAVLIGYEKAGITCDWEHNK